MTDDSSSDFTFTFAPIVVPTPEEEAKRLEEETALLVREILPHLSPAALCRMPDGSLQRGTKQDD
ncbi:hypothetical protein [Phormidesmis priestleyi]